MKQFVKQPSEILDYDLAMEEWFEEVPGDDVADVTLAVACDDEDPVQLVLGPGGLPEWQPVGNPATRFKVWVGGGTDGKRYTLTATVTTESGRVKEIEFRIKIKERG